MIQENMRFDRRLPSSAFHLRIWRGLENGSGTFSFFGAWNQQEKPLLYHHHHHRKSNIQRFALLPLRSGKMIERVRQWNELYKSSKCVLQCGELIISSGVTQPCVKRMCNLNQSSRRRLCFVSNQRKRTEPNGLVSLIDWVWQRLA